MLAPARSLTLTVAAATTAALVVLATPRPAAACGPDFPIDLLSRRATTLDELPEGIFLDEVTRLVPAPARPYKIVVGADPVDVRAAGGPEEVAAYEAGVAALAEGDREAAEGHFAAVLALPPAQRRVRSTWAAYMLGELRDGVDGVASYARVRALVADGFLDDRGLAVSSLGQEALLHLRADDVVTAVQRYAEQAAHGDASGATSLLFVVRAAIRVQPHHPADEAALLAAPIGQRLLGAYLFSRAAELTEVERARLWRGLTARRAVDGAATLAAAAYRDGRWELAATFAAQDPDAALARWVRAKLALRDGDRAAAEELLLEASLELTAQAAQCDARHGQTYPRYRDPYDGGDDTSPGIGLHRAADRTAAEAAILALVADEPAAAMVRLWPTRGRYPYDVSHVAERVLTIDELRGFIDGLDVTSADVPADPYWSPMSLPRLRDILARRLMRAERFDEAIPYFAGGHRVDAVVYAGAVRRAATATDPIERARAYYEASLTARRHGLEILGTEQAPDWASEDGNFDHGPYDDDDSWVAGWMSRGERRRIDDHRPFSTRRFHYRYLASALAERAADQLPRQSQAFAATLCHAARYIFDDDRARVAALYGRYVRDGASVDFAGSFGERCPEPELERARRFLPRPQPWPRRAIVVGLALAGLALTGFAIHLRRRGLVATLLD